MDRGYDDFEGSLLGGGPRRAEKLFRVGTITAGVVGALALVGTVASVARTQSASVASVNLNAYAPSQEATTTVAAPHMPTPNVVNLNAYAPSWTASTMKPAEDFKAQVAKQQAETTTAVASASGAVSLKSTSDSPFDKDGRFIMRAFDRFKPMSSFLPGVGGLWGVPMWTFYVNRGQGIATFGVENKEGGLLLFQTADRAYQITPFTGFRTFLKGKREGGAKFESQPFLPASDADAKHTATRDMYIGNNEMEIEESDPDTGIKTNALYFTAPAEDFPALIRRVTYTNEGADAVELEVVDGLAKLEPAGTTTLQLNAMGRTLEGWMHVYNFAESGHTTPFFHLVSVPADTADVTLVKEGHFAVAFLEDDATLDKDGKEHELLPMFCDQGLVFGTDTTLTVPRRFFSSAEKPGGDSLAELIAAPQSTTSRTPSAMAAASFKLKPGESKTLAIVYGHAPDLDTFVSNILPKLKGKGYVSAKRAEAAALGTELTERVAMSSGVPLMDNYAKQNYLDNLLRGGMPQLIGSAEHPVGGVVGARPKIFHAFSRIHGDLERDYNNFVLEQAYWSQGPGNFRDVNQNRRCDVLQLPVLHDFNVRQFLSYVQHDGYNQLTVATAFFKIRSAADQLTVAQMITPPGPTQEALKALLSKPFRPGQFFNDLKKKGIGVDMGKMELLELVTKYAEQVPAGSYSQNGFWTDHFTYHLDLVHNFVSVYPDEKESMLYDSEPIPFFLSPGRVANRTEKNMLAVGDKVRQYDAVLTSAAKSAQLQIIVGEEQYVGDTAAGGQWQRTAKGTTMKVSMIAKLIILAVNKFAHMDPLGMGVEMEAGKPGWNDAMNGLPALFGSEMPSAYELHEIVDFAGSTVDEAERTVSLPEEVSALLDAISEQLQKPALKITAGQKIASGGLQRFQADFEYWDKVHDALEGYRAATDATFTGEFVTWPAKKLGKASGVLGLMLARMDQGIQRALSYAPDDGKVISPSYFYFTVRSYKLAGVSGRGLPTVKIEAFEPTVLPLFLEGPTRHLKTLKDADVSKRQAVYDAVAVSTLHDKELSMYKIGESLKGQPMEIGRMMAFDSGWLENESIWMHMSYKWYLELLRAGLYDAYFKEIKKGVVCFMDTDIFGRSPLEAASFIVSSAFPDEALHGSGFLARLSGTTAEFLSMWNHMMVGATPFTLDKGGKLQLSLAPVISEWMWREDGTLLFKFLGGIEVTYVCKSKKASWKAQITSYDLDGPAGKLHVDGATVPMPAAGDVRSLNYEKITVTME